MKYLYLFLLLGSVVYNAYFTNWAIGHLDYLSYMVDFTSEKAYKLGYNECKKNYD